MSDSHRRNVAFLCVFLVLAAVIAGCGGDSVSKGSEDNALIHLKLENGGFAGATPKSFSVPPGALTTLDVRNAGGNTYRLSVLASSTAQTFKIPANSSQTITIAQLGAGDVAKLVVGHDTRRIVADGNGKP